MTQKIFIGKISKGLEQFYLPFNIDNDAFPTLYNAYSWRGRVKRKRGTTTLGRLQFQSQSVADSTPPATYQIGQFVTLSGAGAGSLNLLSTSISGITKAADAVVTISNNLFSLGDLVTFSGVLGMTQINGLTGTVIARSVSGKTITVTINSSGFSNYGSAGTASLVSNGIVPGSVNLSDGTNTYTEPAMPNGNLVGTPAGSGTINYASGAVTIAGGAANGVVVGAASVVTYSYFPGLPVMGLRDLTLSGPSQYPNLLAFDTHTAYQLLQANNQSPQFYNVSFYKTSELPVVWTGQNYQQFWTTNYQGALWATNNKPGLNILALQNQQSGSKSILQSSATQVTITVVTGSVLMVGDLIWFNEVSGTIGSSATANANINGQTGQIATITVNTPSGYDTITVNFTGANGTTTSNFTNGWVGTGGIIQLLTNSIYGQDGIKWYDGDPTGGTGMPTGTGLGWVNFAPPLTAGTVPIDDEPAALYYLVGALAIVAFKDRLIFFAPYIQTSSGSPILLNDVALWSWNGTPYYASPVPAGQTYNAKAYYVDQTGYGGWLSSGINQNVISVNNNEDVLLVGFTGKQTRFVYTSNDLYPFLFYIINSEFGPSSTFSTITLDRGALSFGQYGIFLTSQIASQRIDLQIPNQVFQLSASSGNNAALRLSAARDYYHEWVHFTFFTDANPMLNANPSVAFPNLTLQYNYREESWGFQYENFTSHGYFRRIQGYTWANNPWNSSMTPWSGINESWNSGVLTSLFPAVIAGNPQGFVVIKNDGTGEAPTGAIQAIAAPMSGTGTQITSINHCVNNINGPLGDGGDYLYFSGLLGTTYLNGQIGRVTSLIDPNNFVVDIPYQSGTYEGLGTYTRLSQPLIQTKQFPAFWNEGRKVRLGVQKYLLDYTDEGQVTLNIYLSQDPDNAWNAGGIVPSAQVQNSSLIYSQILYTCPEAANIGLSQVTESLNNPAPIADSQYQIWHRVSTSLIGDTFQIGMTLSDVQMRNLTYAISEIALQAIQIDVGRGPLLA
jgi:hypothetical protein